MNHWLFKSEPDVFSINDLKNRPGKTEHWDGIRNYQARNFLRDEIKLGDRVLFYHSNCKIPGVVGVATVVKEAYPDHSAWDVESDYFDPKSTPANPRWFMVDLKWESTFAQSVPLSQIREDPLLSKMRVAQRGNRLSILPVEKEEFEQILQLSAQNAAAK